MKRNKTAPAIFSAFLLCFAAAGLCAEIRFPSTAFEQTEISAAQQKAASTGRPIAFVYTNKETTCGLCIGATEKIIEAFRSSAVIVYVKGTDTLPENIRAVFASKGKYIPKVALFDAKLETSYGLVTYEEIKADAEKSLREIKRAARK